MYKVQVNNMKFHSHIGLYKEEKKLGQNLEIDLIVDMQCEKGITQLEDTISYSLFYNEIARAVSKSKVDLIETLATDIIKKIKRIDSEKIAYVLIKIRKLAVPIDGIFDSVEVVMGG